MYIRRDADSGPARALRSQSGSLALSSPKSEHVALAEKLIFKLARRRRLGASSCVRRLCRGGDQGEPGQKPHQKGPPGLRAPLSCCQPLPFRAAGRGPVGHPKAGKQALEKPGAPQGGVAGNCAGQGLLVGGAGQGRPSALSIAAVFRVAPRVAAQGRRAAEQFPPAPHFGAEKTYSKSIGMIGKYIGTAI